MRSKSNIQEILTFLRELAQHNDRTWFQQHKAAYDALRKPWEEDMERLISLIGDDDESVRGLSVKNSVYRIYRDVRFSKDKSPYKTYFAGVQGKGGRHTKQSSYYVHFQPGNIILGGGIWWPEKPILDQLRGLIDAEGEEFLRIVNPILEHGYRWDCETLKRMPKGYSEHHPMAKYLKMKEYIMVMHPSEDDFDVDDWVALVAENLRPLKPLHDFLNYVFED